MYYNNSRDSSEEWSVSCERDCQDVSEADGGGQGDDHDHQWDCQGRDDHGQDIVLEERVIYVWLECRLLSAPFLFRTLVIFTVKMDQLALL